MEKLNTLFLGFSTLLIVFLSESSAHDTTDYFRGKKLYCKDSVERFKGESYHTHKCGLTPRGEKIINIIYDDTTSFIMDQNGKKEIISEIKRKYTG